NLGVNPVRVWMPSGAPSVSPLVVPGADGHVSHPTIGSIHETMQKETLFLAGISVVSKKFRNA
ncbi:MAG TPA: hypothetical protein PLC40_12615, partial [Candidatus Hydrogenedentes bacterium]|nr:hypothetical protein [Candidatus Hydrogenedentota bacterium]